MLRNVMLMVGVVLSASAIQADVVELHSGGKVVGKLETSNSKQSQKPNSKQGKGKTTASDDRSVVSSKTENSLRSDISTSEPITIKTLSGGSVTLADDDVERIDRRKRIIEEHDRLAEETPRTVESLLELADWCKKNQLSDQRVAHLHELLTLDPDHAATRKALGYVRHGGSWMNQAQIMAEKGLVRHKGKWILPQELAEIEQAAAENDAEKQWYKPVRMWYGWVTANDTSRQSDGLAKLREIRDSSAVPAVMKTFQKGRVEPVRLLLVELLTNLEHPRGNLSLLELSLYDEWSSVRTSALETIRKKQIPGAIDYYVKALHHENNLIVNRAGAALGIVGDDTAVIPLIDALVTRHKYKFQIPENVVGRTEDGRWIQAIDPTLLPPEVAGMLATGQLPNGVIMDYNSPMAVKPRMRTVVVRYDEKNPAVLESLTKLTGESFNFDEQAWRKWRSRRQTSSQVLGRSSK